VSQTVRANPAVANAIASADETNTGRMFINLKPKGEREPIERAIESLRRDVRDIPGITVYFIPLQNLRIGGRISKARYQYVLKSVGDRDMQEYVEKMLVLMRADPVFRDATTDAQLRGLQARVNIDRDKANQLGVQVQDIRTALYSTFGERQVSTIFTTSDSYPVILQAIDLDRRDESAFAKVYLRAKGGTLVPLSSIATIERKAGPIAINHAGQLEAITLSFNLAPGAALGDAARKVERFRTQVAMPASVVAEWAGDAAAFKKSQASQIILLVSALLVIYVLLGVLYESYIHPITILAGIPSAAIGALATLMIFGLDLSMIAVIGVLLLIGIVKKNAIMMIDFALNAQRTQGIEAVEAIRQACLLRFRPIMMTTFAAMMGAIPIAAGLGAGAELRQPLGLVVVGGLLFSQVITLFITPVIFLYLDRYSGKGPVTQGLAPAPAQL
jgi:HAE1 family hydrophobic/amphiphilic exporter-1